MMAIGFTGVCFIFAVTVQPCHLRFPKDFPDGNNGWELKLKSESFSPPIIAGESLLEREVVISIRNGSRQVRSLPAIINAYTADQFILGIKQPDGRGVRIIWERSWDWDLPQKIEYPAGARREWQFALRDFGFDSKLKQVGKHVLSASWATREEKVSARELEFEVIEPDAKAVVNSVSIPLAGRLAMYPDAEKERAFIQQIVIGDKYFIYFRKYLGAKYGGTVSDSVRLACLDRKTALAVAGVLDFEQHITLVFCDSPFGITVLRISYSGRIVSRYAFALEHFFR